MGKVVKYGSGLGIYIQFYFKNSLWNIKIGFSIFVKWYVNKGGCIVVIEVWDQDESEIFIFINGNIYFNIILFKILNKWVRFRFIKIFYYYINNDIFFNLFVLLKGFELIYLCKEN